MIRIWVLEHERGTGKAQVGLDRRCGSRRGFLGGEAARRRQSSPERGAWAPRVRRGLRHLVQRRPAGLGMLTQGLEREETRCRRVGGELGGDGVAELVDRSLGWSSGLRISTGRRGVVLRRHHGGQRGPGTTGGEGIPGRSGSPELSSGRNSGEVGPDVGDGGLGGVPGAQAKLLRWLGLAGERRSTASTAAQGSRRGGAERGGPLGLVRLRQGEVGCGRGPGRV